MADFFFFYITCPLIPSLTGPPQIGDTDIHKPLKDTFRAFVDEWLGRKMRGWVTDGIRGVDLVARMSAVTSMPVLRNNAPAWLSVGLAHVTERDAAGTNIISRGYERVYGVPARSPAVLAKARARAAERQSAAAAAAAAQQAATAAAGAASVEAAVVAVMAQGGSAAAIAAAVLAAQAAASANAPAVVVPASSVCDASMELVGSVAALEAPAHAAQVPKMPKQRAIRGTPRPGMGSRVTAAERAAGATLLLEDDTDVDDDSDDDDAAAEKPKRRRAPAKARPKGPAAKRGSAAAAAAASSEEDDDDDSEEGSGSGGGSSSESSSGSSSSSSDEDDSAPQFVVRSNRSRPVGPSAAAAPAAAAGAGAAAGRTKEEHKIPRLWQAVQELATAGKVEKKGAAAWQKVHTQVAEVLLVCEAGDDTVRAGVWKGELVRMETAYKAGGAAITACEVK